MRLPSVCASGSRVSGLLPAGLGIGVRGVRLNVASASADGRALVLYKRACIGRAHTLASAVAQITCTTLSADLHSVYSWWNTCICGTSAVR